MSYLLDTNAVSEVMRAEPEPAVLEWLRQNEGDCFLSAVTVGEIERGIELLPEGQRKRSLRKAFLSFQEAVEGRVLAFDLAVARRWAVLTAAFQKKGRRLPVLDSMIEATALHWNLILVTRNAADFAEVRVLDPWRSSGSR